jgi:hypothetical protein
MSLPLSKAFCDKWLSRAPAPSKVGAVGLAWLLAVCASCSNNLAQELAWDRWKKCGDYPGLFLNSIDRDGEIWVRFADGASDHDLEPWRACLRRAEAEQAERGLGAGRAPREASGSAPTPGTPRLGAPEWKRGDAWAYRWESPRGKGTFIWSFDHEETLDGEAFYVVRSGSARETYYRKKDLAYYMDKVNGEVEYRHTPPTPWAPWPFRAGARWEVRFAAEQPAEKQAEQHVRVCESSDETITVPAGTFDAVKVVCRHAGTGALSLEIWYSLAVKQMVRERSVFAYGVRERELIAYKLR